MNDEFKARLICVNSDCSLLKITVKHKSGLEITSPIFNTKEKSTQQVKKIIWDSIKILIKNFDLHDKFKN